MSMKPKCYFGYKKIFEEVPNRSYSLNRSPLTKVVERKVLVQKWIDEYDARIFEWREIEIVFEVDNVVDKKEM